MYKSEEYSIILRKYKINQTDLAEKIGINQGNMNRYLNGQKKITHKIAMRIYKALIEIAEDRMIESAELSILAKKLLMNMSDGDSISDM